tara:strand:- start:1889 stop:2098 length:210 start_codon:yes stop_codon:yes gene_type:complete
METEGNPYAMIDSSNLVVDLTIWDGDLSNWSPPSGITCIGIGTEPVGVGMTYNSSGVGVGTTSANKWIV